MTRDQTVLLAVCVLAVLCAGLTVALVRVRLRSERGARALGDELVALRVRLEALEQPVSPAAGPAAAAAPSVEYLITDLGQEQPAPERVRLGAPAFADIVVKETVIKAASLAHGVRRGLAPATRNRIRFEMKQEVRRARKQRRADLKATQREVHARQRRAMGRRAMAADGREAS